MRKSFTIFSKNNRVIHYIALFLIVCVGLADVSLYVNYVSNNMDVELNPDHAGDNISIVTESHFLDTALADEHYTGKDSDSENGMGDAVLIEKGKNIFNILEILPTEKKGVVGYLIGGCEPFDVSEVRKKTDGTYIGGWEPLDKKDTTPKDEILVTKSDMKMACMDAMINKHPGYGSNTVWNGSTNVYTYGDDFNLLNKNDTPSWYLNQGLQGAFSDSTGSYPFVFESDQTPLANIEYKGYGYYKYVGPNKGVYRIENFDSSTPDIYSRFYETGNRKDYNYIFVENEDSTKPEDKNVSNHKRLMYRNNEMFIKNCLGKSGDDVEAFKKKYEIEVVARTPISVTLDDIERADVIFINDANNMRYYTYALNIWNLTHGIKDVSKDVGLHFYKPDKDGSSGIDFNDFEVKDAKGNTKTVPGFEKVVRIYERVVVREDAAIIVEENCCPSSKGDFNTNMRKLMCMLFYVKKGGDLCAGRDLFADYIKRYTDQPGEEYLKKRIQHLQDPKKYPVDYRATSLKNHSTDPSDPAYYYMHFYVDPSTGRGHVGHPLVLDVNEAITGPVFAKDENGNNLTPLRPALDGNGKIIPEHDTNKAVSTTLYRYDSYMFTEGGIPSDQLNIFTKDGRDVYAYDYAYNSMSNTTDFVYIDDDGKLIVDDKYSSNTRYDDNNNPIYSPYWFRIDRDGEVFPDYAFRRRLWERHEYDAWPWDEILSVWVMKRNPNETPYDCNMHMWYEYNEFVRGKEYTGFMLNVPGVSGEDGSNSSPGVRYENECLVQANEVFKTSTQNWIYNCIDKRKIKREKTDEFHKTSESRNYYFSMNILNGDGVNERSADKNKTLYYNQYEEGRIVKYEKNEIPEKPNSEHNAYIPISIQIKTSCKLKEIKITGPKKSITYELNTMPGNDKKDIICLGTGGKTLVLKWPTDEHGNPKEPSEKTTDNNTIYTYDGMIYDVMYDDDWYKDRKNTKIKVDLTVVLPDDKTEKTIPDTVTIVKRDFFMLN